MSVLIREISLVPQWNLVGRTMYLRKRIVYIPCNKKNSFLPVCILLSAIPSPETIFTEITSQPETYTFVHCNKEITIDFYRS